MVGKAATGPARWLMGDLYSPNDMDRGGGTQIVYSIGYRHTNNAFNHTTQR
jgi:hypothetical protein